MVDIIKSFGKNLEGEKSEESNDNNDEMHLVIWIMNFYLFQTRTYCCLYVVFFVFYLEKTLLLVFYIEFGLCSFYEYYIQL